MWIRNAPKLHITRAVGYIRREVLKIQDQFLAAGRLDEPGDIFHLTTAEIDRAVGDTSLELLDLIAPRKAQYMRAKVSKICPLLVDSRSRILKPNVVRGEPGTLVGTAISPGVATGRVRVVTRPTEK